MAELGADFYALTSRQDVRADRHRRPVRAARAAGRDASFIGGGSMIHHVRRDEITWAQVPAKFEGGTPAIGEAVGYAVAVEWLEAVGLGSTRARGGGDEYALERLAEVPGLRLFGPPPGDDRRRIVSFALEGVHAHDVSEILDRHAVCARAGHHCAQVLMDRRGTGDHPCELRRLQHARGDRSPGGRAPRRAACVRARLAAASTGGESLRVPLTRWTTCIESRSSSTTSAP